MKPVMKSAGNLLALTITLTIISPARAEEGCETLLTTTASDSRDNLVTPERLATLRDIGPATALSMSRPAFSLSPDGRSIAFQLHQGDPTRDRYCVGIVVVRLNNPLAPRLIDTGHELIISEHRSFGWKFPIGSAQPITPHWSPDGSWISYLKRVDGITQVWRAPTSGGAAQQLTHSAVDIEDLRVSTDGQTIVTLSRPDTVARDAEIDREQLTGWRYDDRAFPVRGARPQTPDAKIEYIAIVTAGGAARQATPEEKSLFARPTGIPSKSGPFAFGPNGSAAWAETIDKDAFPQEFRLVAQTAQGQKTTCQNPECLLSSNSTLWWTKDGKRLRFSRTEGWSGSLTGFYEWVPGGGAPRRLYQTSDDLIQCVAVGDDPICLRERSLEPRHFVQLQLGSGQEQRIYDPNPDFAKLQLGKVERMQWRNDKGTPFYGDLVYPVSYDPKQRYPMIVVQYRSKGFLRGSVNDEVPIQTLAAKGYFVFSMDSTNYPDMAGKNVPAKDVQSAFNRDFQGRRQILSAMEIAVRELIARGLIDEKRIGLTGFSDGCTTLQYASIHSTLFSAASTTACAWDPMQDAIMGPLVAKSYQVSGWPSLVDKNPAFWSQISFMDQPERVPFPILYQASDNEFLTTIGSFTVLREYGVPTDMYIFADEDHIKRHPAHRLATYRRNLAWFDFWLKDQMPADPAARQEAERWSEMRKIWEQKKAQRASPPARD